MLLITKYIYSLYVRIKVLMEAVREELRTCSKGKSLIKFTTIYPIFVSTGMAKKPRIRYIYITIKLMNYN